MIKVGVAGGIGSGKTYVCTLLEKHGYPVYYSDQAAKRLMHESSFIKEQLINHYGQEIYSENQLNRKLLADIIFNNESEREFVNGVVHPAVHLDFENWVKNQNAKLVFYESALLFETKAYTSFDATILVVAPLSLRIERTMKRDSASYESVKARIDSQGNQEEYCKIATYCISNDNEHHLMEQLNSILAELLK